MFIPLFRRIYSGQKNKSRTCKDHLNIYVFEEESQQTSLIINEIESLYMEWTKMIRAEMGHVYFLPASRSGIYSGMNAFGSIVAELSRNRAFITKKIEFPGISEPISDYFIALSNIKTTKREQYSEWYGEIEHNILNGEVVFDKSSNSIKFEIPPNPVIKRETT